MPALAVRQVYPWRRELHGTEALLENNAKWVAQSEEFEFVAKYI